MMFGRQTRSTKLMANMQVLPAHFQRASKAEASDLIVSVTILANSRRADGNPSKDNKGCTMDEWQVCRTRDLG